MKKSIIFSLIILALLSGCKSQQKVTGYNNDDVYSNRSANSKTSSKAKIQNNDLTAAPSVPKSDSSVAKKPASSVDYSNNSYAARIKKFNNNNQGLNNSNGSYAGNSDSTSSGGGAPNYNIYLGDTWGYPYWGSSFYMGYGYGWGDFGFGFGYPYWGYPYYYYPYYYSWNWYHPYWGGHFGHHYWDWYGNGGNYYGRRTTSSAPIGGKTNSIINTTSNVNRTEPVKNQRTVNPGYINHSTDQTRANVRSVPPDQRHYNYTRSQVQGKTGIRNNQNTRGASSQSYIQHQTPSPKYSRPGAQTQMSRSNTQSYSSQAYRQPKSSQEYINPHTQQGRPTGVTGNTNRSSNINNTNTTGRRYATPGSTGGNSRIFSNPSSGSRFYSTPSRSFYSPSRSSGSGYSAPSHSGGGGSSHSGGGGGSHSGGGGRR